MKPLRIALDATPLTVPTGGVRRYVEDLTAALKSTFPEDEYCLLSDQLSPPANALDRRWWLFGLRREMDRLGADAFHGTDFAVPYLPKRPSVMTLHDLSPWRTDTRAASSARVRRRTPWLIRLGRAAMIITPTEAVRREAISRFGISPARITVTPLAASVNFRPVATVIPPRPYFLFIGTIEKRKNLGVVIEAWRLLNLEIETDLIIAGSIRDPIDPAGATLHGPVPDSDLPLLYSGAAATLYPSLYEGFGLPVLEAMQCGSPIIASRDPAIVEVAGNAALHANALNVREWTDAMRAVLSPARRAQLRESGLRRAAQFSWEKTARLTRDVYVEAIRRR